MNFLKNYPEPEVILSSVKDFATPQVNGHVHTPYSFSAFEDIKQIFTLANQQDVKVLAINDFYTVDGYHEFYEAAVTRKVFPLFSIEFMALSKELQSQGIRVNDPSNPGRIYFCGKGLNYPFSADEKSKTALQKVQNESNLQVKEMVAKTNAWLKEIGATFILDYANIKKVLCKELVRERHIAKALRINIFDHYKTDSDRKAFVKKLYSGKDSAVDLNNINAFENEIRSVLLKTGGKAFVAEDENAFLSLDAVKEIIINAGGIPCYPVLLDDAKGNITEFEKDQEQLLNYLKSKGIYAIELIPNRNDFAVLKPFVQFFAKNNFLVTFGTEHNTPELTPLTMYCKNNILFDDEIHQLAFDGACVIAAHQYLKAQGKEGYIDAQGKAKCEQIKEFAKLGKAVIGNYLA